MVVKICADVDAVARRLSDPEGVNTVAVIVSLAEVIVAVGVTVGRTPSETAALMREILHG